MKAAMYEGPNIMRIVDIPKPQPKAGEVLVKIKSCGICGSDVHGFLGLTGRRTPPMVMGHEFTAEIVELGANLTRGFKVGDRVAPQPVVFCGECVNCQQGFTHICLNKEFYGCLEVNGTLMEYLSVPEKLLYTLPDHVSYTYGALIEPLAVAYCAVMKLPSVEGKNVVVVGAGTIGLLIVKVLSILKPKSIIVSDLSDKRLAVAKEMGATHTINPEGKDIATEVRKILGGELADFALEAVGATEPVRQAMSSLKSRGTCVWVGNSQRDITVNMQEAVTNELKVVGTYIYTHEDYGKTIDFLANNDLGLEAMTSKEITLDETPAMFEELAKNPDKYLKVVVSFD